MALKVTWRVYQDLIAAYNQPKSSYEESTTDTQSRIAYRVRGIGTAGAIVVAQVERYILVFLM